MTKKSLLITNDFPPIVSGISTAFFQLWKNLPSDKIIVLAPRVKGCSKFDKAQSFKILRKWIPLGESPVSKLFKSVLIAFYCLFLVSRHKVKKLHCGQILSTGLAGMLCKRFFGIPYGVYVYGSETVRFRDSRVLILFINKIIDEADELIPNSEFTLNEFLSSGIKREKMVKVVPGVDTTAFCPANRSLSLAKKFNLEGCRVLLTVSRLDERKGHDMVIRALPKVLEKYPNTKYLIVGGGREKGRLQNIAMDLGLIDAHFQTEKVVFAGYVENNCLPDYYNLCDIFIMPNRETSERKQLRGDLEGFGIVFLEASACGKPVIAGRSGGANEAVEEGVTGLFVNPHSIEDVSNAVIQLFDDESLSKRLAQGGRRRAKLQYDWKLLSKTLLKIL